MFKNVLRKLVGFGLVLCIVGSGVLTGPVSAASMWVCVEPFTIYVDTPTDDD